jgi:hypothetical protein
VPRIDDRISRQRFLSKIHHRAHDAVEVICRWIERERAVA